MVVSATASVFFANPLTNVCRPAIPIEATETKRFNSSLREIEANDTSVAMIDLNREEYFVSTAVDDSAIEMVFDIPRRIDMIEVEATLNVFFARPFTYV